MKPLSKCPDCGSEDMKLIQKTVYTGDDEIELEAVECQSCGYYQFAMFDEQ